MGLVPLAWLAWRTWRETEAPDLAYWWLAGAFAVSWVADSAAHVASPWAVSLLYPITQAALVGFVLLDTDRERVGLVLTLAAVAIVAVAWRGVEQPDVLLHTAAWLSVAGIVVDRRYLGRMRVALLVYFGVGCACWWAYVIAPGWTSWSALQLSRALGLALFCYACVETGPVLRLRR